MLLEFCISLVFILKYFEFHFTCYYSSEMKKQKSQSQQEEAISQNPFLQNLMSRVQTHIQAQQEQSKANSSKGQPSLQPSTTSSSSISSSSSSSQFNKSSTQASNVSAMETGSKGPGSSWASQMQTQHGGHPSIAPYVPLSSSVSSLPSTSNLPSNTFEYGHSSKSVQPGWSGGFGVDVRDDVSSGVRSQAPGEKPSQEKPEVFDYGHKSKAETPRNQAAPLKGTIFFNEIYKIKTNLTSHRGKNVLIFNVEYLK